MNEVLYAELYCGFANSCACNYGLYYVFYHLFGFRTAVIFAKKLPPFNVSILGSKCRKFATTTTMLVTFFLSLKSLAIKSEYYSTS